MCDSTMFVFGSKCPKLAFGSSEPVHALVALLAGAALAGAVFGVSHLFQRRLYSEVQALMPGGLR